MTEPALYTAKQASVITSIDSGHLQTFLDRKYLPFTVVPQGDRTYRKFTREQLIAMSAFSQMLENNINPKLASVYLQQMDTEFGFVWPNGIEFIAFQMGLSFVVQKGESPSKLKEMIGLGAYVLDYEALGAHVDREIGNLAYVDRYIELHPEKFETEAES